MEEWIAARRPRYGTLIVGIDGAGAAGKSTLAAAVARRTSACVVAMDDFYRPSDEHPPANGTWGGEFDAARLRREVLEPLAANREARYGIYDWEADRVTPERGHAAGPLVIVEGVYVLQPLLRPFYGLAVWVDAPREERLRRGLARDGEDERHTWEEQWMPQEDRYVAAVDPRRNADAVLDASSDPTRVVRAPGKFEPSSLTGTV